MSSGSKNLVGKAARCPEDFDGAFGAFCAVLRPFDTVDPEFFAYYFQSFEYRSYISDVSKGTNINNLRREHLLDLVFPLPSLSEQHQIVSKLKHILTKCDASVARILSVLKWIAHLRQSLMQQACSGQLTKSWRDSQEESVPIAARLKEINGLREKEFEQTYNSGNEKRKKPKHLIVKPNAGIHELPKGWFWATLENVSSLKRHAMSSGPFGSNLGTKDYRESGVPVIRGQNIREGLFSRENFVFVSDEKALSLARSLATPGDVVVVAVGSSGRAAVVPNDLPMAVLSQNCNKITVDSNVVLPQFVSIFLQVQVAKEQLEDRTTDTVRQFLSLTNLKRTVLPVPPLAEQVEIVHRISGHLESLARITSTLSEIERLCSCVRESVLSQGFSGQLLRSEELADLACNSDSETKLATSSPTF
jgi:type I restriction enzyme S subunit